MIPYLLHVSLLMAAGLLFYKLLLQKETFYRLNRWVLLAGLPLFFGLPLLHIPQSWSVRPMHRAKVAAAPVHMTLTAPVIQIKTETQTGTQKVARTTSLQNFKLESRETRAPARAGFTGPSLNRIIQCLGFLYWAGVVIFGINLLVQVGVTLKQILARPVIADGPCRIVELSGDKVPCSFWNYIFINPEKYDWDTYSQILAHEKVHVRQRHSLDIMLAELAIVFQWFNPFAWLYRRGVESNLEYLTDEAVTAGADADVPFYQLSLLKVSNPHLSLRITTNYNQSLLKKRILMMNAKKSNFHTLWKYFALAPVFGALTCALNQPVTGEPLTAAHLPAKALPVTAAPVPAQNNFPDETEGYWFATLKGEKINIDFKNTDDDHNWSSSSTFLVSDFSALPKEQKGDFTLSRDAGTIRFNGKFDGEQGYGHYKFTANREYLTYLKETGVQEAEDRDLLTFTILNVQHSYLKALHDNGFITLSKGQLISLAALKVDAGFIRFWRRAGFKDITASQLVSAKAMHIDSAYVHEIQRAGYPDITVSQLMSFKAQGVNGSYIAGLRNARKSDSTPKAPANADRSFSFKADVVMDLSPTQVISAKAMHIDSTSIREYAAIGYGNLSTSQLSSFRVFGITPEYIKEIKNAGYDDLDAQSLISLRMAKVTPEYIKALNDAGYRNLPAHTLTSLKMRNISPAYIKAFEALGYAHIEPNFLVSLKMTNLTPEFIKSFQDIGYKDIPLHTAQSLKLQNITPAYIKGFNAIGFTDVPLNELSYLKMTGVTPEYVASMQQKGLKSTDLRKYAALKNSFN